MSSNDAMTQRDKLLSVLSTESAPGWMHCVAALGGYTPGSGQSSTPITDLIFDARASKIPWLADAAARGDFGDEAHDHPNAK